MGLSIVTLFALAWAASSEKDIWLIGIAPFTGRVWDAGESMRVGAEQMLDLINGDKTLLPGYRLRLVWQDGHCTADNPAEILIENVFTRRYFQFGDFPHEDKDGDSRISTEEARVTIIGGDAVKPDPVGILCCGCSVGSMRASRMSAVLRYPMISATSTMPGLSDRTAYPNFFRTISPDTARGPVICEVIQLLGISRATLLVAPVYSVSAQRFVSVAESKGLTLVGKEHGGGIRGAFLSELTWLAAMDSAVNLRKSGARVVLVFAYTTPQQVVMCATARQGLRALVWFPMYFEPNLWKSALFKDVPGSACSMGEVVALANGAIYVDMIHWRRDVETPLTCAPGTTAGEFMEEYFRRQQVPVGTAGPIPANYSIYPSTNLQVDAVCMYALMLRELLVVQSWTVEELAQRSERSFNASLAALGNTHFQGLQGEVLFEPGRTEPKSASFAVSQVQASGTPCQKALQCGDSDGVRVPEMAVVQGGALSGPLSLLPGSHLKFHFQDEVFSSGDVSNGRLSPGVFDFQTCSAPGTSYDPGSRRCESCPSGKVFVRELATCTCTLGFFADGPDCLPCPAGSYSATLGSVMCDPCPVGRFAVEPAATQCALCPAGTYSSEVGSTTCTSCSLGHKNPRLWTTMRKIIQTGGSSWSYSEGSDSFQACGCDRGARMDSAGECVPCAEGIECYGMSAIKVLQGYYSEGELSVYKCRGDSLRCSGGPPGETCNRGRTGLACSECLPGMIPGGPDGACVPCEAGDSALFVCTVAILLPLCISISYRFYCSGGTVSVEHKLLVALICMGQSLTAVQVFGLFLLMPTMWPAPFDSLLQFLRVFSFNTEFVRMGCVVPSSPIVSYSASVLAIILILGMLVVVHCLNVLLFHNGKFIKRWHILSCAVGTWLMAFCIPVVSTVLTPFQCEPHPNGKHTVRRLPGVHCFESETYTHLVIIGVCALICIPLPHVAHIVVAVRQFPRKMLHGDIGFLKSNGFLFFRFNAEHYWYALVVLARNLAIAIVPVIAGILQIVLLETITLVALTITMSVFPWRAWTGNCLEVVLAGLVVLCCGIAAFFSEKTDAEIRALGWFCTVFCLTFLCALPCLMLPLIFDRLARPKKRFQFFLCHHKAGAGAFARLLKITLLESKYVTRDVFLDSDDLVHLDTLFEYVAHHTETLVMIASHELFRRPWCVGEMTVSRLNKVNAVLVQMPDAVLPDENLITNYDEMTGCHALTAQGIGVGDIRETLRWVLDLPSLEVIISDSAVYKLTAQLCHNSRPSVDHGLVFARNSRFLGKCFMLGDVENSETMAAAMILQKMLLPHLLHLDESMLPEIIGHGMPLPQSTTTLIFLLSPGSLFEDHCVQGLVTADVLGADVLPVTLVENFHYPSTEELQADGHDFIAIGAVQDCLKVISVPFTPQNAPHATLELGARNIARRIQSSSGDWRRTRSMSPKASVAHVPTASTTSKASSARDRMASTTSKASSAMDRIASTDANMVDEDEIVDVTAEEDPWSFQSAVHTTV